MAGSLKLLLGFDGSFGSTLNTALVGVTLPRESSDEVVRQTDRVLGNWGRVSGSGDDPDPGVELGSHDFSIGADELLSNIFRS